VLGFDVSVEGSKIALSQRQQSLFQSIAEHVQHSAEALGGFLGPAVATEEITLALEELASLRGADAREHVLDRLFSKFCIGK
jgi:tRNA U34 5-carboxymethylaminomethyl modifying GTPase MnmE/TrmE